MKNLQTICFSGLVAMSVCFAGAALASDSIPKTKEAVEAYITDHVAKYDQGLWFNPSQPFRTDPLGIVDRCNARHLKRTATVFQLLHDVGMIEVSAGAVEQKSMFDKRCSWTITKIDDALLKDGLATKNDSGWYFVPLVSQKVESFRRSGVHGHLSHATCDMYAEVKLRNVKLSAFSKRYRGQIAKHSGIRRALDAVASGEFCRNLGRNGKGHWEMYERLSAF